MTARLEMPPHPHGPAILLAHGAGAGQDHPFMAGMRSRLAAAGHPVMTFDYPYAAEARRAPDRLPVLLECHRAALERLRGYGYPMLLAGKSMGGRVGSHLASGRPGVAGLIFFGYPLVSPSSGEVRDTSHLADAGVPMLFVAGSRDRLAPRARLRSVVGALPGGTLEVVEDADHGFRVPKRTGMDTEGVLDRLAGIAVGWIAATPGAGGSAPSRRVRPR